MSSDEPAGQGQLPDNLLESLDRLEATELQAVRAYAEHRLEEIRPPITEQILTEAAGEVVNINDQGAFTLVRMLPPTHHDSRDCSQRLYRVRREKSIDGEEGLHWSFIGYISDSTDATCDYCGAPLDESPQKCPQCGQEINKSVSQVRTNE